ncbi:MAG: rhomboid family intramembrane serine protease [Thermoleophilia bacterium]
MIPLKDVNPTSRPAVLTIALIAVCTLVLIFQTSKPDDLSFGGRQAFICEYGLVADHTLGGADASPQDGCEALNNEHNRFLGVFTSQFLHADWMHLIFNMLFLWVFGNNIEDRLGRLRYLPFYLACGAIAGLAQAVADPDSAVPLIGASGAISGVLGAYLVLYPRVGVWTVVLPFFFLPFKIPAWIWLLIYLALQVLYLGDSAGGGDVAYLAHIGGFVAGAALIRPFAAGRDEPPRPSTAVGPLY